MVRTNKYVPSNVDESSTLFRRRRSLGPIMYRSQHPNHLPAIHLHVMIVIGTAMLKKYFASHSYHVC